MTRATHPTMQAVAWSMKGFLDAALEILRTDVDATELRLYFYAATRSGWNEVEADVAKWIKRRPGRKVIAYIGTDHGLTDPAALAEMARRLTLRLMRRYNGVFHPKVIWFLGGRVNQLLVGSNNLTGDGLRNNIEFGTWTQFKKIETPLQHWHDAVHEASDPLDKTMLASYMKERQAYAQAQAQAQARVSARGTRAGVFTWSGRSSAPKPKTGSIGPAKKRASHVDLASAGSLVMEIMPLETGTDGNQIQIPMKATRTFFGLGSNVGATQAITLRSAANKKSHRLHMTLFGNSTARLVISDLDYSDRPCVIVFRRARGNRVIDFQIVARAVDPDAYKALLRRCGPATRTGSRRWTVLA